MDTGFQSFQRALGRHLRDPQHTPRPAGVPARRMAIYNELLFNNLTGFLDPCFPVCRALLGATRWRRLCRTFYRDWTLHTPWFREIPREFARYLAAGGISQRLPAWLPELAHYEWAELAVDIMDCTSPAHDSAGDPMHAPIVLNPALMNLAYNWPVHRIGPDYRPRKAAATHLVVFRDADEQVQFTAINPVTGHLLARLAEHPQTGTAACRAIAEALRHPAPERLLAHAAVLLDELRRQGIVLGVKPS